MSTDQEISGAEREALGKAFEGWTPLTGPPMADLAWVSARDYYKAQFLEQNGKLGAATAAIQRERDEAEQRADMSEEREKKLREKIIKLAHDAAESPPLIDRGDLAKRLMDIIDA